MNDRERAWIFELARRTRLRPWMRAFIDDLARRAFDPNPKPLSERQRLVLMRELRVKPR